MEEYKKQIEFVTLPVQVAFNKDLTPSDKMIFWIISSLDGEHHCWATNNYIAKSLNISVPTVSRGIANLIKHRYITVEIKDNNSRIIQRTSTYLEEYKYLVHEYNREGNDKPGVIKNDKPGLLDMITNKYIYDKDKNLSFAKTKESVPAKAEHAPYVFDSEDVKSLFVYWNLLAEDGRLRKTKIADTKSFHNSIKGLKEALKKYTVEEIAEAMDCYDFLLSDDYIKSINMSFFGNTVGLDEFFGFREYTRNRMLPDNPAYGIKSWFDECLNGKEYLMEKYVIKEKNDCPYTTEAIRKEWMDSPFCVGKPTLRDENNFVIAAKKLNEWLEQNRNRYNIEQYYFDDPPRFVRDFMFPSLLASLNGADPKTVTTAWLCTDSMFARRVHLYLVQRGLVI